MAATMIEIIVNPKKISRDEQPEFFNINFDVFCKYKIIIRCKHFFDFSSLFQISKSCSKSTKFYYF